MHKVPEIKAAYDWAIKAYSAEVATAMAAGNRLAVERLDGTRDLLERGFFVLLFGQFEAEVTQLFERVRDKRSAVANWVTRRGWDVPEYIGKRVPFETKLALVLDRRDAAHGKVLRAYATRNHCAHGGHTEPVGSIDQFVNDLYAWQSRLTK
ncbi:hypothetical protein [Hyphomicrobium sp.]|uniref:hypothetical protein n=1 Tax=Hyphomicrobium sp. TaxID=82 RepID=UPI001D6CD0BC|nr:hypothetical protein [Hyphomicrobium sp.]MBY0558590.1 hypothetical protein [Hyphomicrobium sp.]